MIYNYYLLTGFKCKQTNDVLETLTRKTILQVVHVYIAYYVAYTGAENK